MKTEKEKKNRAAGSGAEGKVQLEVNSRRSSPLAG